jgi:hypothetical protein
VIQDPKAPAAPIGVVYDTSMTRPDAALALTALYAAQSWHEARVNGICVTGSGFDAAIFCDIVAHFYTGTTRAPNSNSALPIGFAADPPLPPNPAMVEPVVTRTRPDGQPQYTRTIQRVTDTAAPDALLRNAITFSPECVVVLSAPATWLARSLALAGTAAQYKQHVDRIVVVEGGDLERDASAAKALFAALPLPAILVGREIGQALNVPRDWIQHAFAWAAEHPVSDAIAAAGVLDVPLFDVAALHYALHPDSGFFRVTGSRLSLEPSKRDECLAALVTFAAAKPSATPKS